MSAWFEKPSLGFRRNPMSLLGRGPAMWQPLESSRSVMLSRAFDHPASRWIACMACAALVIAILFY
jgi:hypothetical protein